MIPSVERLTMPFLATHPAERSEHDEISAFRGIIYPQRAYPPGFPQVRSANCIATPQHQFSRRPFRRKRRTTSHLFTRFLLPLPSSDG